MVVVVLAATVVVVDGAAVEAGADVVEGVLVEAPFSGEVTWLVGAPRPDVHPASMRAATTTAAPHR